MATVKTPKVRKYNPTGTRAYLNKPIKVKPSKKSIKNVAAAQATYKRTMDMARKNPTGRNREGILYTDLAAMLKARGRPMSIGKIIRMPKNDAMKLLRKYSEYDVVKDWKKVANKTKSSITSALGSRTGNADFLKKIKSYSRGELYSLVITKNYDINKFLFSNSPNAVILQDGSTESADVVETMILDILEGSK